MARVAVPRTSAKPPQPTSPRSPPSPQPAEQPHGVREPVWLVRAVLVLFLVGFAAFLAREARGLLDASGVTRSMLYWSGVGIGLAAGLVAGAVAGWAASHRDSRPR